MGKTLYFEGAGYPDSDRSGDVGNCRIRTAFTNKNGDKVYLEMLAGVNGGTYVDFAHKISDDPECDDCNQSTLPIERSSASLSLPWSIESVKAIVNGYCGGDFADVKVLNDLTGYRVHTGRNTRTEADYNYGDEFVWDEELTALALKKRAELSADIVSKFPMNYDNTGYWLEGEELVMRLAISENQMKNAGITDREQRFKLR